MRTIFKWLGQGCLGLVGLIVIAIVALVVFFVANMPDAPPEQPPAHSVEDVSQPLSSPGSRRLSYRIRIPKPYTQTELLSIAKWIVDRRHRTENQVSALSLLFYLPDTPIGGRANAGIHWAPFGDWSEGYSAKPGDYENFRFNVFHWNMPTPRPRITRRPPTPRPEPTRAPPTPTARSLSATPASPTFAATPVPTVVPIPTPTPASALQNVIQPTHTPTPISRSTTYTVQAGDSLSAIAERFGVELDDLIALNEIDDPNVIAVGTVLEITIESTVGAESAVTPKSYVEGHVTPDPSVWERVKHITPRPGIPGLTPRPTSPPRTVTVRGPARSAQFRCLSSTDGASMRAHGQELARLWSALGTLLVLGEEFGVDPIFWTASEKRQFTSQLVSTERIADRIRNLSWKTGWPQSLHNVRNPAVRAAHNVISARQSFAEYDRTARDNALNNGWGALADAAQNWRLAKGAFDRLCR